MAYIKPNAPTKKEWEKLFLERICPDLNAETAIETGLIPPLTMRNFSIVHDMEKLIADGHTRDSASMAVFGRGIFNLNGNPISASTLKQVFAKHRYGFTEVFKVCSRTPKFITGMSYHAKHIPTKEDWHIIGINIEANIVCAAGYPPTIGRLSDCEAFEENAPLTEEELSYRKENFGINWL